MGWRGVLACLAVIVLLIVLGPVLVADFVNGAADWVGTFFRNLGD